MSSHDREIQQIRRFTAPSPLVKKTPHHATRLRFRAGTIPILILTACLAPDAPVSAGDTGNVRTVATGAACAPNSHPDTVLVRPLEAAWSYKRTAINSLEHLRQKVEEWGVATISAPVAVFSAGAFEVPEDILDAKEAFKAASTDVNSSSFQSLDIGVSNQFTAVATPTLIPGFGGSTATSTTTTSTVPPLFNSAGAVRPSLNAESLTPVAQATVSGLGSFTQPFALLPPTQKITVSPSQALRTAQDLVLREKLYHQMSIAKGVPNHSEIFFVVVQVSCNPGWRTKEHYIADCSASLEYFNLCDKKELSRGSLRAPTVFSVLPLLDAQTVEMANSQRQVTQLAFQLAASLPARGVDVKANDIFNFVKRYAHDSHSVTAIPVVNSYSSGGTFGFRFSPSFQALRDPSEKQSKAANVLLPTSFPALITVVLHHSDLREVAKEFGEPGFPAWKGVDSLLPDGTSILTHVSTRWYLKDRLPLTRFLQRLVTPMKRDTIDTEVGAAADVAEFYKAKEWYGNLRDGRFAYEEGVRTGQPVGYHAGVPWSKNDHFDPVLEEMRRSIIDLESKGLGRSWPINIGGKMLWNAQQEAIAERVAIDDSKKVKELQAKVKDLGDENTSIKAAASKSLETQNALLLELLRSSIKGASFTPDNGKRVASAGIPEAAGTAEKRVITEEEAAPAPLANLRRPELMLETPATQALFPPAESLPVQRAIPVGKRTASVSRAKEGVEPTLPER